MDGQIMEPKLTFSGHVQELRRRLTWPALLLLVGAGVAYMFHDQLIVFMTAPLNQQLYYTTPAGGFNFIMKICFILGITLAIPALIYNIISFIEPAVGKKITRRLITMVTLLSLTLGVAGAAFAYFGALPMSLHFFQGVEITGVNPLISADDYLNFALACILTFILLFQLPLLILFINHIKPMSPRKLLKYERHVIVGSLALALVLPFTYDPLTQFLIALPIILLYNLSVFFVYLANRKANRRAKAAKKYAAAQAAAKEQRRKHPSQLPPAPKVSPQPAPRPAFIEPVLQRRSVATHVKRPTFDIAPRQLQNLQSANFLDLRPNK